MKLGYEYLEHVLSIKKQTPNSLGELLTVSPQAISNWKSTGTIPTKRAYEISDKFQLSPQELDQLLGIEPLHYCFRTKSGSELTAEDVSNKTRYRAEVVYERFFKDDDSNLPADLTKLKEKITKCENNYSSIANEIRSFFEFQSYQPISRQTLNSILERIGVKYFYLPFKPLGLLESGDNEQTAILYTRNGRHAILINSDRTIDEAHFDLTHELIHIFFEDIFDSSKTTETLIDKVAGELVYPKSFIFKIFFNNEEGSKPIKDKDTLTTKFINEAKSQGYVISPRGIARSMRDCELTTDKSELYKFFYFHLHDYFRNEYSLTYSELGNMNIDFTNRESILSFYETIRNKKSIFQYPLFEKLQNDLINEKISTNDFADTFSLKLSDGIIIKSIWTSKNTNEKR